MLISLGYTFLCIKNIICFIKDSLKYISLKQNKYSRLFLNNLTKKSKA